MVKLNKQTAPIILQEKAGAWKAELLQYISEGKNPPESLRRKYNHPDVKKAVQEDSFDKCIYCESVISAVYFCSISPK